jgi:hypothetical protein
MTATATRPTKPTDFIVDFVRAHTERGECRCGQCFDRGAKPEPQGDHTIDMVFFKVALVGAPSAADFRRLTRANGTPYDVNPLDGAEHNYLDLGAWIGGQGLAMQYMALGTMLSVFKLLTPYRLIPDIDQAAALRMAQGGLLIVTARDATEAATREPELAGAR